MLGVDAQANGNPARILLPERPEPLHLLEGIEDQVVRTRKQFNDIGVAQPRREAVHLPAELLAPQARLPGGTGADTMEGLPYDRKHTPHGKALEGKQYLRPA